MLYYCLVSKIFNSLNKYQGALPVAHHSAVAIASHAIPAGKHLGIKSNQTNNVWASLTDPNITFYATRWRFKRQFRFICWKENCSRSMFGSNGDQLDSPSDQNGIYISHESTRQLLP